MAFPSCAGGSAMALVFKHVPSPVGRLKLVAGDAGLVAILWEGDNPDRVRLGAISERRDHSVLAGTERQLGDYFFGGGQSFGLRLGFRGTNFQKAVWQALLTIPFGETRTYGEIAR